MPKRLVNTCSKEMQIDNCGLDHDYSDSMVRSQWQSRSRNNYYLLYRWLVAIFVTTVVLYSFVDNAVRRPVGYFFIYFTHWGIMINMVVGLMGAILVTIWHFHDDFHESVLMRNDQMPRSFKIYWALHNTALISSFVVTIIYWGFLHNEQIGYGALNILCHAFNSVIMFLDVLIVAYPLRLFHVVQPIAFAACFGVFSYIYYVCGGKDMKGNPWIYPILDWAHPEKAVILVFGILLITVTVHTCLFWIYKLREFIHRRYIGVEINLTTKSMEFNENIGHTNDAFKTSIVFE